MADSADTTQLLDIDVDQLAGAVSLIPPDGLLGSRLLRRERPWRARIRATVELDRPTRLAICGPV